MSETPIPASQEDDALAAELALGVLDGTERAAAEARLRNDPALMARVIAWQERLAPLNDAFPEAPVPADLLNRIEGRLFPAPAPRRTFWMALSGLGMASVTALAVAAFFFLSDPPAQVEAVLVAENGALSYDAVFDGLRLTVSRAAGEPAPEGQVHELWIIAPGADPVSLGLLAEAPLVVAYPTPPAGWVLAVTVEPAGGAPGGKPTGPVILKTEITL